eukprot:SAG11_NODE_6118_length_1384_cov_8.014008_1_plen_139_part_00
MAVAPYRCRCRVYSTLSGADRLGWMLHNLGRQNLTSHVTALNHHFCQFREHLKSRQDMHLKSRQDMRRPTSSVRLTTPNLLNTDACRCRYFCTYEILTAVQPPRYRTGLPRVQKSTQPKTYMPALPRSSTKFSPDHSY